MRVAIAWRTISSGDGRIPVPSLLQHPFRHVGCDAALFVVLDRAVRRPAGHIHDPPEHLELVTERTELVVVQP